MVVFLVVVITLGVSCLVILFACCIGLIMLRSLWFCFVFSWVCYVSYASMCYTFAWLIVIELLTF